MLLGILATIISSKNFLTAEPVDVPYRHPRKIAPPVWSPNAETSEEGAGVATYHDLFHGLRYVVAVNHLLVIRADGFRRRTNSYPFMPCQWAHTHSSELRGRALIRSRYLLVRVLANRHLRVPYQRG
jgi:hypothetical protein